MPPRLLSSSLLGLLGLVHPLPDFASSPPAQSLHFGQLLDFQPDQLDADGRAQAVLTLGPDPGTNPVGARVSGLEPVTFSAVGVGTRFTPVLEGDLHTWHLPEGATARLGKGRIGRGDRAVVFSPDGRLLAVGTHIGVWLYEVATSREVALLPARHEVLSIAFSPDGKTLASGELLAPAGSEGMVRLWDLATGTTIAALDSAGAAFETQTSGVSLAFSPDGAALAVSSKNGVKLWDVTTQSTLATYDHRGSGSASGPIVSFSADGTVLASGADDGTIRLWDVSAGTLSATLEGHGDEVTSLSFSPDGSILASGSRDHTVRLWDVATGANTATLDGHAGWVFSVAISPDGMTVASGSGDDTVRLWDAATGDNTATFEDHISLANSVAFSPDGTTLASWSADGTVKLWDAATGSASIVGKNHPGMPWSIALSPDGTTLASGYGFGTIRLWEVTGGNNPAELKGHTLRINSLVFSADGSILVSGSSDGTVRLWDVSTGAGIGTLETQGVSSVALSPDGTTIASGHFNGTARLWDVATGAITAILEGHTGAVSPLVFSPDGATLATGEAEIIATGLSDPKIRLWDVATGDRTATFDLDSDWIASISFSREMTPIAVGGMLDASAELWDLATSTRIAKLPPNTAFVTSGAFSPDGSVFVFGGSYWNRPTVEIWDFGAETRTPLFGHGDYVDVVEFWSGGTVFASGARDGTVLVWDMQLALPHPRSLAKLSGDEQAVPAGAALPVPFVVAVLDQNGDPLPGAAVTFAVTAGGGTLSATTATTDENGRAATTLTLGSDPGRNTVTARVAELEPVVFGATGQAIPQTLAKVSGNEQEGPAGTALAEPFVVEVRDQANNPLPGAQVAFLVTSGEGTLSVVTDTTDASGHAAATLTLGSDPGRNTVTARVAGLKPVIFGATGQAIPQTLAKVSGEEQQAAPGIQLAEPFVVSVVDQNEKPLAGATVTFAVTAGDGTLSTTTATTDGNGRASSILTLGSLPGANTVTVSVAGLDPVTFTATAEATPDFDGDGETGFSDFFLFADAFGSSDPRFDLDGSGTVDFADFFLLADHFGEPARGKLLALAREMIGLPDGPQLQQNAPNPFNSETVISWFLLKPGPARVEMFALSGQRVAILHQGPQNAGVHRVHWDGRDDRGRSLGSGVYLYRLVTEESVRTRKLTLLR